MLVHFSVRPRSGPPVNDSALPEGDVPAGGGQNSRPQPLSALVEGSWDGVMSLIRGCHQAESASHPRGVTTIVVIEDGLDPPFGLKQRIPAGQCQLNHDDPYMRRIPVRVRSAAEAPGDARQVEIRLS